MRNLPAERLGIAVYAIAHADRAFQVTSEYAADRHAFGQPIGGFQVNRFALAEMKTKLDVAHAYLDRCVQVALACELTAEEAAGAKGGPPNFSGKSWTAACNCTAATATSTSTRSPDSGETPECSGLDGGTTEIMKEIVGRSLGF